jgi:putative endonuclease
MHYVYVLYSPSLDQFYRGQTAELQDRIRRHNLGYEKATQQGRPWSLCWYTIKDNRSQGVILETKLKNLSRKKLLAFMQKHDEFFFPEALPPPENKR